MARRSEQGEAAFVAARRELADKLRERSDELEQAVTARVAAIADPSEVTDPCYLHGLMEAIVEGIEFAITVVERDEDRIPIPVALLAQARTAARCSVGQATVLQRCVAAHHIITDAFQAAAIELNPPNTFQRRLRSNQSAALERLLSMVCEEYEREERTLPAELAARQATHVTRLLEGETLDTASIDYDFEASHLAIVAAGDGVDRVIDDLARALGGRSLLVRSPKSDARWAWIACETPPSSLDLDRSLARFPRFDGAAATGEFFTGLAGWRLSHAQALAAFPLATRKPNRLHRYSAVAIAAIAMQNLVLRKSLEAIYLEPIFKNPAGATLRETLCAYFAADRNGESAAAALGTTRQTVSNRLRVVEQLLGRSLASCGTDLEIALRLPSSSSEE